MAITLKEHEINKKLREELQSHKYAAVQARTISLSCCLTADMLADMFTKQLPRSQFEKLRTQQLKVL